MMINYEDVFVESMYRPVRIKSIKKISNKQKVYDLSVKDHKSYCTNNGIIGHNSDMGAKAKQVREYFRIYSRKIQKMNMCLLMTAHYTQRLDPYGPPKVVGGGTIMAFAPSLTIELSHNTKESDIEKSAKGASIVGLRAKIIKSRLGTYGKQMEFEFNMNQGLDPYSGLFNILKDYGIIIPAAKDLEAQIKEKNIPKKSTGAWIFNAWEYPEIFENFKKHIRASGKFREKEFNGFCAKNNDWIIDLIQSSLDKATHIDAIKMKPVQAADDEAHEETEPAVQTESDKPKTKKKTEKASKDKSAVELLAGTLAPKSEKSQKK